MPAIEPMGWFWQRGVHRVARSLAALVATHPGRLVAVRIRIPMGCDADAVRGRLNAELNEFGIDLVDVEVGYGSSAVVLEATEFEGV